MVVYLYFAMAVITWDWFWVTTIPTWNYQERIILVLLATPTIATDLFVIYEAYKTRHKRL